MNSVKIKFGFGDEYKSYLVINNRNKLLVPIMWQFFIEVCEYVSHWEGTESFIYVLKLKYVKIMSSLCD
jgi:hypothetical protein